MQRATIGRLVAGGIAAVVVVGAGTSAAVAAGSTSIEGNYRVATAATGSVDETLALSGTIETKSRRDEAFAVAGTVDSVLVSLGQHVDAGAALATVATDSLQSAVDSANSTLTDAQQQLDDDLAAQSATTTTSTTPTTSSSTSTATTSTASIDTKALQQASDVVKQRQQALLAAITAAGTAIDTATADATTAKNDSTTATADCAVVTDSTSTGYVDVATLDPSASDYATKLAAAQAALATCQTDQAKVAADQATVQADQTAVQTAQAAVQTASQDLDAAIQALQQAAQPTTSGSGTGGASGSAPSSGSGATSGSGGTQTAAVAKPSSADIVADRAAIAAADAQVGIAQHDLDAHTLTAAISGTVAAIDLAVGDRVSAGSTSEVITILGDDGYTVTTSVPLTEIAKLKAGQTATVELPALGKTYSGTVSSVGVVNVSTDSSTPSYDVTIAVDAGGDTLRYGSAAAIEVAVASVTGVLTVPLSAVTTSGGASTVKVLKDGKTSTVTVTTGAVGTELIEIDSGLQAGDQVVLADLSEGVPTSTSSTTRSGLSGLTGGAQTFGGSGTFGGAGFGGTGRTRSTTGGSTTSTTNGN